MRRYELMLVLRPDLPDDKVQGTLERTARAIAAGGGQIVKQAPWGRRRLAYPIDHHREGSYYVLLFEAPPTAITELERGLLISEEVLRHLVTRVERPVRAARGRGAEADADVEVNLPSDDDEEPEDVGEFIDESESEAAPAAID
jgi:small subunit ribosomal protein S6